MALNGDFTSQLKDKLARKVVQRINWDARFTRGINWVDINDWKSFEWKLETIFTPWIDDVKFTYYKAKNAVNTFGNEITDMVKSIKLKWKVMFFLDELLDWNRNPHNKENVDSYLNECIKEIKNQKDKVKFKKCADKLINALWS
jgi:hypothetical protein